MNAWRPRYYHLEDKIPVPIKDVLQWRPMFHESDWTVNRTEITDNIDVSTVFLGLDHGFDLGQPGYKPLLFETMVLGGPMNHHKQRYSTWKGAEYGHQKIVKVTI